MTSLAKTLSLSLAAAALLLSVPSRAEDQFQKTHPRRAQVNGRLKNQNARIKEGEKSGKISKGEAHQLHQEHQGIRSQERADAAAHGGHITKGEQRQLNKEENGESRQIYNEKH